MMFAKRAAYIKYAIRDVVEEAKKVKSNGKEIINLNIGDPLKYDFETPKILRDALKKAVDEGYNYYADSIGERSTREAIAFKEKAFNDVETDPENIIIGNGVSEIVFMISAALLGKGDEILVPSPSYPIYITYPKLFDAIPVEYKCIEEEGWAPDVEDIRSKITEKTKAIVIINPNNPTGALYGEKVVKQITDLAAEHDLVILSDEIYDHNVLEGKFTSTAKITDYPIIGLNGISKSYMATGWRLGYMYLANPDDRMLRLKEEVAKVARARLCANTPVQKASEALFLKEPLDFKEVNKKYRERRDFLFKRFNEIEGISTQKPKAAFYIFPKLDLEGKLKRVFGNDKEFVYELLWKTGVLTVFGSGFGECGKSHFRAVYLPELEMLKKATDLIEKFIGEKIK